MIRQAVSSFFRRKPEERFWSGGPIFFDNGLGPIKWITPQDGTEVTHQHAFQLAAFHACVRVIAESVASLPFHLIREIGDGRERVTDHPLYKLVHDRPNPMQSAYEMLEGHVQHVATWGNAYLLKVFGPDGQVEELWPLHPSTVFPQQLENLDVVYDYMSGQDSARRFTADRIIHTRYLSDNGYLGMVPLQLAGGVIEQARAMDQYASRFWVNDARPGVILETSVPVPEQALVKLRQNWEELHRGVQNAGRTAVLPTGVSVKQLPGITNEASQWTEVRTFCVEEVARQMRVPGSLIGIKTPYSTAEQEALNWLQCLVPWCRRVESSFGRSLLDGMDRYAFQLDTKGMLRGDNASRAAFYTSLHGLSVLSPNDIRRLEDMPAIDNPMADEYYVPTNNLTPMSVLERDPAAVLSPLKTPVGDVQQGEPQDTQPEEVTDD